VHGDVFRAPSGGIFLSCLVGNGVQLLAMTVVTLFFACLGFLSPGKTGRDMGMGRRLETDLVPDSHSRRTDDGADHAVGAAGHACRLHLGPLVQGRDARGLRRLPGTGGRVLDGVRVHSRLDTSRPWVASSGSKTS